MNSKKNNIFKKLFFYGIIVAVSAGLFSCNKDSFDAEETYQVTVKLNYPDENQPREGVTVKMENSITGVIFEEKTNENGEAKFEVNAGKYDVSVSETRISENSVLIFNGVSSGQVVTGDITLNIEIIASKTNQLIIKELYNGGCQKDDGSGHFQADQYIILYNNSSETALLKNLCIGAVVPSNSQAINNDYEDGKLFYEAEGWIPTGWGMWTFQNNITIAPGDQIVVAVANAVDNTQTYSNSINFNNPAYYAMYDPASGFSNTYYYPSPAPLIPVANYLKSFRFPGVTANAWTFSVSSPAAFIFTTPEGTSPADFATNPANYNKYGGWASQTRAKVPTEWILDAIEVYAYGNADNQKRLTSAVDAGYVELYIRYGFSLYRNVDKAATEAISENAGKIVYGYNLGTVGANVAGAIINGSTDPSGIDAEASIKNGARIIYKDTNNSTNDFHQRSRASLRN